MSRTRRRPKTIDHDRGECPWCQGNLHHKHARHEAPLFEEDEYEPSRVIDPEGEDEDGLGR